MGSSMVADLADPFAVIPLRSKDAGEEVKLRMHETWLGVVHDVLLKMDLLLYFDVFCFVGDVAGRYHFRDPQHSSFLQLQSREDTYMASSGNF